MMSNLFKTMRILCSVLFMLCIFQVNTYAQDGKFTFRTLSLNKLPNDGQIFWTDTNLEAESRVFHPLKIPHSSFSMEVKVKAKRMAFFKNKNDPKPFAQLTVQGAIKKALLVFVPSFKNGALSIKVVNAADLNFLLGDYQFYNFSQFNMGLVYGDQKVIIPRKSSKVVKGNKDHKASIPIKIFLQKKKVETIMNSRVPGGANRRIFFFAWIHPDTKKMQYKVVTADAVK